MVGGKEEGVPLMDHVEASISPEVSGTGKYGRIFRPGESGRCGGVSFAGAGYLSEIRNC